MNLNIKEISGYCNLKTNNLVNPMTHSHTMHYFDAINVHYMEYFFFQNQIQSIIYVQHSKQNNIHYQYFYGLSDVRGDFFFLSIHNSHKILMFLNSSSITFTLCVHLHITVRTKVNQITHDFILLRKKSTHRSASSLN